MTLIARLLPWHNRALANKTPGPSLLFLAKVRNLIDGN